MVASVRPAFCVVDVGTGGVKCLVFDRRGSILFVENSPINFHFDGPAIDFDPHIVWTDICKLTRRAVARCKRRNFQIVAVSSTSMREGNVFYDRLGQELLAVPNLDARAYSEAGEVQEKLGASIYSTSGHWPSAIFALTRLRWLFKNQPSLFQRVSKFSMINDWVLFKFSGKLVSEPTNGCETALFDLKRRDWSDELIRDSDLDRSLFPEIEECGTRMGEVSKDASKASHLKTSTAVIVGAADTEAAVAGCGLFEDGDVAAVAGTTTPVQTVLSNPIIDREERTWTCCHVVPDRWTLESNAGATGLIFKWWSEMVGRDFATLDREVEETKPDSSRVKLGIGTSVMNARHPHPLSGAISGMTPWTPRAEITLAILQTNCFSVRANVEQLEKVLDRKFPELYFCGGASKSNLWTRLQADILGRPLVTLSTGEATGRGAAMLSSVTVGEFHDLREAAKSFLRERKVLQPKTSHDYDAQYKTWLQEISK